ncbi:MAG: RluA family pseudouridine synthase [Clostridia bacterium]
MRSLTYIATIDGSIEQNLTARGISSGICVSLRKSFGQVARLENGEEVACKIVDNVRVGQAFRITLQDEIVRVIPPCDIPVKIVYQDDDVAVIDKQKGLAVISSGNHYGRSLENALANIWGQFVYRPVNRLDRDTSGLMIVAKNQLAHSVLSTSGVRRKYIGLCQGEWSGSGQIDQPINKVAGDSMRRQIDQNGKPAQTDFCVLASYLSHGNAVSIVAFELRTGRTHQIRAHCQFVGHPLCADKLYDPNGEQVCDPNGKLLTEQALHSAFVQFRHPITGKMLEFVSIPSCVADSAFEQIVTNSLLTKE